MILIRLKRHASGNKLSYSIVVCSHHVAPKSQKFFEQIGHYYPLTDCWDNRYVYINYKRLAFWLYRGAKMHSNLFVLLRPLLIFRFLNYDLNFKGCFKNSYISNNSNIK